MKKIIHTENINLRCDTCGHTIPNQKIDAGLVGTRCPVCGNNMLTQKDFEKAKMVMGVVGLINKIFGPVLGVERQEEGRPFGKSIVNPHNNKINFKKGE